MAAAVRRAWRGRRSVRRVAEDGLVVLRGVRPEELRELVAHALEPVLKPLVFREPLALVEQHRARGERVYIVSAALQEIVDALAEDLGFDGALGTVCDIEDGVYTGRTRRALHGRAKAEATVELAEREGIDLAASTAYSDSESDLPFLELAGNSVAVNPDRRLRRVAHERGWTVLEFGERAYPHARRRVPPVAAVLPLLVVIAALVSRRRGG